MNAVIFNNPLSRDEIINTAHIKIILEAGAWGMSILDRSEIPTDLPLTTVLAFHLALDDEQNAFYNSKPILTYWDR